MHHPFASSPPFFFILSPQYKVRKHVTYMPLSDEHVRSGECEQGKKNTITRDHEMQALLGHLGTG